MDPNIFNFSIFNLLWLLLPVAAFSGWYVGARRSEKHHPPVSSEYIKGLDYLLNQQTGKAVETLIKLFEVNQTTVDTHIVLGNLFRQKGELEKAIRIHHNVISRPHLDHDHKAAALLELGQDYFNAGLLDSAEKIFRELVALKNQPTVARGYRHLVALYEMEKSWKQAIECGRWLKRVGEEGYDSRIAYYHCELAEKALEQGDYKQARENVAKAVDKTPVRAAMICGDVEFLQGRKAAALRHYANAFSDHSRYARVLLPKIRECFQPYKPGGFADYINALEPKVMTGAYVATYIESLLEAGRDAEAEHFLINLIEIDRAPLPVLKVFIEDKLKGAGLVDDDLIRQALKGLSHNERESHLYECSKCGFKTYELYWHCPSCHAWGTATPRDIIENQLKKPRS